MVRLENIRKNNNGIIEADFYPENSADCGHISVDIKDGDIVSLSTVEGYGAAYSSHAARKLFDLSKQQSIQTKCTVMWY